MLSCIVCSICTFKSGVLETGGSMSILWFWSLKILLRFNMEIKSANFLQQLQQQEEIIFWKNSWGFSLLVKSLLVSFLVFFCFIIQTRVNARKCRQARTPLQCSSFNAFVLLFSVKIQVRPLFDDLTCKSQTELLWDKSLFQKKYIFRKCSTRTIK